MRPVWGAGTHCRTQKGVQPQGCTPFFMSGVYIRGGTSRRISGANVQSAYLGRKYEADVLRGSPRWSSAAQVRFVCLRRTSQNTNGLSRQDERIWCEAPYWRDSLRFGFQCDFSNSIPVHKWLSGYRAAIRFPGSTPVPRQNSSPRAELRSSGRIRTPDSTPVPGPHPILKRQSGS